MAYNYTEEQVREAIAEGGGTIAQVAKRLQCSWLTARKYIDQFELRDELPKAQGTLGEMAEETIYLMLAHAMTDLDYASSIKPVIIFTAKAKAGWVETSGLLIGEDNRSPYERLIEAIDSKAKDEPESGEGTETE